MMVLGFDTSNYTTSVAAFDGAEGRNCSRLLDVRPGELGLRQSDAVFSHVKRLPELTRQLFAQLDTSPVTAVGVSSRPRAVEGSYMPCFLSGVSAAETMAAAMKIPCYHFSHQQGHIAAVLWSAGRMELMRQPFLAWHLSGGTTELLLAEPEKNNVSVTCIGGTTDISAGQIMDRTGLLMGLNFPAGRELDQLAQTGGGKPFRIKSSELQFSLSGLENKIRQHYENGASREDTAAYAISSVCSAVFRTTEDARAQYGNLPVIFSGGVASNSILRKVCAPLDAVFAPPQYSTDNALGIAVLTWLQEA